MFLDPFFTEQDDGILITAEQGSHFAKDLAGDFNPIHDPDARRFVVPGDLLFALVLARYGVSEHMRFTFAGMVGRDIVLTFPETDDDYVEISGHKGKTYLNVTRQGGTSREPVVIESLVRSYVAFSGHNFPHVLMPLLQEQNVMINPDRPLVIYESMGFDLSGTPVGRPHLEPSGSDLVVHGKRADVTLRFQIHFNGVQAGEGFKKLVVSGLREYDPDIAEKMIADYGGWKDNYTAP